MRKYILFILFLCGLSAARGQTDGINWHCDYWFDNDYSTLRAVTNGNGSNDFQIEADASSLSEGLHSINIQALGFSNAITGFSKVKNEDYSDELSQKLTELYGQEIQVEIEDVVVNTERQNLRSVPVSRYFVKAAQSTTARCWFDDDMTTLETVNTGEALMLDVTNVADGFHWLNVQAVGKNGGVSAAHAYPFVKIPQVAGVAELTCLCMIDDQLYRQEKVANDNGVVAWTVDVASLPQGFHRIFVQVVTPTGAASTLYRGFFCRETTKTEFGEMKCVYAIDGGNFDNVAGELANGIYHFDLDVAKLTDGLHRISYMLSNGKGVTTKVQTQFFTKIPLGGYGTVEYWYWLNNDDQNPVKVKVDPRQNPFELISMVDVPQLDIRSSQFAFGFNGSGQPTVYAKNTFHARFYDAGGRFVDLNRDYIDQRVSVEVTAEQLPVISLARQRGPMLAPAASTVKTVTVDRPAENVIQWFKITAQPGEILRFCLDRAATLQLFAPSGKEVYSAEGAAAVNWGEIYAEESGDYYLALHDVTATYGNTVTLSYEKIDKYAVLRQDVATVGNGGPSTITFQGNGFDQLKKVSLVHGGTTINSVRIDSEDKAVTSVKFDFGGAPIGDYDAVFHFGDEDETVTVDACITVEQAVPVIIDGMVSYSPQFLVALGNKYVYRFTNHGNMTAYDILMKLRIVAKEAANIISVVIDDTELTDYTQELTDEVEGFPYQRVYDITRTLRPGTTETYVITVKTANSNEEVYVWLDDIGGGSKAVASLDPNEIYGYIAEDGSHDIREDITDVFYTIEFENDPEFATAAAHDIYVTDQLSPELFDLTSYKPTRVQIGDKEAVLSGDQNFLVTVDMRPRINALAQVEGTYNAETGLVSWHISSLDPMTLDPTTEPMDGVLPVNGDEGNGIGRIYFDIALKAGLPVGTEIPNKAKIVFDSNAPIETPTWTNTIVAIDEVLATPLTLEAVTEGDITFSVTYEYNHPVVLTPIEYQINGGSWTACSWPATAENITSSDGNWPVTFGDAIHVSAGDKVAFRGNNASYFGNGTGYESRITSTADVYVYGNIMSLASSTGFATLKVLTGKNAFSHLFCVPGATPWEVAPNTTIKSHPTMDLMLPATTLTNMCYQYMFAGCQGLTRAPELPAMKMPVACYGSMFEGCTSLTKAPALPATEFDDYSFDESTFEEHGSIDCYMDMFKGCTSLTEAPETLPAIKLVHGVYQYMFAGCTSLEKAPVLPAAKVADYAYSHMFDGCTSLNYVKCLATEFLVDPDFGNTEEDDVADWLKDVAATGTFVKADGMIGWTLNSPSGIPEGWTVIDASEELSGKLQLAEGWNWMSHWQTGALALDGVKANAQRILSQTQEVVYDDTYGWVGNLQELAPATMYKVQMTAADNIALDGTLFDNAANGIGVKTGWNWLGYTLNKETTLADALLNAEEGDVIIGLDGVSICRSDYNGTSWVGTLTNLKPGQGYMFQSKSDKDVRYDADAQAVAAPSRMASSQTTDQVVDKHRYPSVMAVVARIERAGTGPAPTLVAYCGDECRGISQLVADDLLMMNVYGNSGDRITFRALNTVTGEEVDVTPADADDAHMVFRSDIVGTLQQPVLFRLGSTTGIRTVDNVMTNATIYDMNGRRMNDTPRKHGVYIVTGKNGPQKVVK